MPTAKGAPKPRLYRVNCCGSRASKVLNAFPSSLKVKGLSVNKTKTVSMMIKPSRSNQALAPVILKSSPQRMVLDVRCLGVMINDRLSWNKHIDFVTSKVGPKIGILRLVRGSSQVE